MDALSFLQSVGGYVRSERDGSADRSIKLATVDPTWSVLDGLLPKVTFDGETTLSGKRYAYAGSYFPVGGDRVWMVPVGTTYLIVGSASNPGRQGFAQDAAADFYATHFGGASARVEVDGGHSTLFVDDATVAGDVVVSNEGGLPSGAPANGNTSSFTFVDMPSSPSFSFTKLYASTQTKLYVWMSASGFLGTANGWGHWGVQVSGTDYTLCSHMFNQANIRHSAVPGWAYITGLAAGTYTVKGRWRSPHGFLLQCNTDDWFSIHMREVPV